MLYGITIVYFDWCNAYYLMYIQSARQPCKGSYRGIWWSLFMYVLREAKKGFVTYPRVSQMVLVVKNQPANPGALRDTVSIPGLGRSLGEGHCSPLQYSCLDNPMDRAAQWATVHRVAKSWTWRKQLSTHTYGEFLWENTSPPWPLGLSALSGQHLFQI